jgi:DNA polymerase I-like protein with 3'-5' exonuclease and polymerase domains
VSKDDAATTRSSYLQAMPAVGKLQRITKRRGYEGRPIRTFGGRNYLTEPPSNGRTYEYKLLNYLIQGSAADQTKQVLCDWYHDVRRGGEYLLTQVYDEINISSADESSMQRLKDVMEQPLLDTPMLTEGFIGDNWGDVG